MFSTAHLDALFGLRPSKPSPAPAADKPAPLADKLSPSRQMALLYRGHRNCSWEIIPSLHRPGVNFDLESQAVYAFVDLLERFYRWESWTNYATRSLADFNEEVPKVLHVAVAQ